MNCRILLLISRRFGRYDLETELPNATSWNLRKHNILEPKTPEKNPEDSGNRPQPRLDLPVFTQPPYVTMVFEVKWTKLHHMWAGHRPLIGARGVQIQFRYKICCLFRNEGDTKATAVENWDQILDFFTPLKLCWNW